VTDVAELIREHDRGRDPERLALKYQNMRQGPFVFLRGTCHLFYARLPGGNAWLDAPCVWACGDLHLENFGSYKADNRQVYFDINDFDEGLLAPASWDLLRLMASVIVGRDVLRVTRDGALTLCDELLAAYAAALQVGKPLWVERETAVPPVSVLLHKVRDRGGRDLLEARTREKGGRRTLRLDNGKALPVSDAQREQVAALIDAFAREQKQPASFRVLDVARRIAGTGSLGIDRYIVLVEGKGSPDRNRLLDLKRAVTPSWRALPKPPCEQPTWPDEATRVVSVQRRVQAVSMALLHAVKLGKHPFVLRRLSPSEDRIALPIKGGKRSQLLVNTLQVFGRCLAWDQLRSSGRDGAASADTLIASGKTTAWMRPLRALADRAARQVEADFKDFARAYDSGGFAL
jgi:uncharacterized protein (DUF2252 family)